MRVEWFDAKTFDLLDGLTSIKKTGMELLEQLDSARDGYIPVTDAGHRGGVSVSVLDLIKPMGAVGEMLLKDGKTAVITECMSQYWNKTVIPTYTFETLAVNTELGVRDLPVSVRRYNRVDIKTTAIKDLLHKTGINKVAEIAGKVRVGSNGFDSEFQFLAEDRVLAVETGDDLMAGIFVRVGDRIQAAPGLNRLVCSNGLTRTMLDTNMTDLDVLLHPDMMQSAVDLTKWLKAERNNKVSAVREISYAFTNFFSQGFLNRFWKGWSEKVELGTLTWYDVIADITYPMSNTLSYARYRALEVGNRLQQVREKNCCPTCSGKLHE